MYRLYLRMERIRAEIFLGDPAQPTPDGIPFLKIIIDKSAVLRYNDNRLQNSYKHDFGDYYAENIRI